MRELEIQSCVMNIVDAEGIRQKLDERLRDRALNVLKARQMYHLIRIGTKECIIKLEYFFMSHLEYMYDEHDAQSDRVVRMPKYILLYKFFSR
jgi:hypothetical protein